MNYYKANQPRSDQSVDSIAGWEEGMHEFRLGNETQAVERDHFQD